MKIKEIEIYGYGKWTRKKFADLADMQVFLGNNEAGKSTLSSFINTIFFGFPSTRKKDINTYVPKQGETYGGRLTLGGTRFGEVIIERVKDKNRGKALLTYPNGQQEVVENLAVYLLGVDRETYELIYTFRIDSLLELMKIKRNDLNRYLFSIGTTGSEKLLQLADEFRNQAQKEFKPNGTIPPLNKMIKETEALQLKLQEARKNNGNYERLLLDDAAVKQQMEETTLLQQELEEERNELSESIRLNDYYREWQRLAKKLASVELSELPPDAASRFEKLQEKIAQSLQKQTELQERLRNLERQIGEYSHTEWFQKNRNEITALHNGLQETASLFSQRDYLEQDVQQLKLELFRLKQEAGVRMDERLPVLEAAEQAAGEQLLAEREQLAERLGDIQRQVDVIEQQLETAEAQLTAMQQQAVSPATFQQWEQQARTAGTSTSPEKAPPLNKTILLMGALAAALLGFLLPAYRLLLWGIAAAGVAAYLLVGRAGTKSPAEAAQTGPDPFSLDKYVKQASLRERMSELESQTRTQQDTLIQLLNEQEELEQAVAQQRQQIQEWLQQMGYPTHMELESILTHNPAEALARKEQEIVEREGQVKDINERLAAWEEQATSLRSRFQLEHLEGKAFLNRIPELYQALLIEENMAHNTQEKMTENQSELAVIQSQLAEDQAKRKLLLDQAHVETEAEFYRLLHALEEREADQKRLDFLDEQLEDKKELMAKYPDKEEAQARLQSIQEQLPVLMQDLKDLQKREVVLRLQIDTLETGGTYSSLLQEYAMAETELKEMIVSWASKVMAAEWIEGSLRQGKDDRLPRIQDDMNAAFQRLTLGAYKKVTFLKNGLKVQREDGVAFQPHELSQGTVEQLYVALRLAFIKNTADLNNMPILVDDSFVNFDFQRKQVVMEILGELSEQVQVFFFTFDEKAAETLSPEQVYVLN